MKLYLKFCLALGALVVAGCGDDDGGGMTVDAAPPDSAIDARVVDAMVDARIIDARVLQDAFVPMAATDAGAGTVTCGAGGACDPATQKCCVMMSGGGVSSMCIANAASCAGGGTAACDGTEDCPGAGRVCCASFTTSSFSAECKQYGTGPNQCTGEFSALNMSGDVVACNNRADCPSDRPICQACTYNGMSAPPFCTDSLLNFPGVVSCVSVP